MNEPIDNYCERLDASFWSEPINAVTNLAFIAAAVLVLLAWRSSGRSAAVLFLGLLIGVIGIGSFLFHTFATGWAAAADSLPILVFILAYLFLAVRSYLALPLWASIGVVVGFIPVSIVLARFLVPVAGSSAGYLPALFAILIVGFLMRERNARISSSLLVTGVVFLVSIGFRMADEPFCNAIPIGTHLLWHILNAVVLYRLAMLYLDWSEGRVAVEKDFVDGQ